MSKDYGWRAEGPYVGERCNLLERRSRMQCVQVSTYLVVEFGKDEGTPVCGKHLPVEVANVLSHSRAAVIQEIPVRKSR